MQLIDQIGYPGIVGLMLLQSMGLPIPSEVVMPMGGWLASDGALDLILVIASGTLGSVIGSVIAYEIGLKGGRAAVERYGGFVLLNKDRLDSAEQWFDKFGVTAIFLSRLLPFVGAYLSFPAGMVKMKFWPFLALTALGSVVWCSALVCIGYLLGPNWNSLAGSYDLLAIMVLAACGLALGAWYLVKGRTKNDGLMPK